MDLADDGNIDIKSQVLQHTLAQVATRQEGDIDSSNGKCCVICLDTISEPCGAQPCKHSDFDYLCLLSWIQEQPRCPLCKADIREVRYDFDDLARPTSWKTYKVPEPPKVERVVASVPRRPRPPRRNVPYYTAPRRQQSVDLVPPGAEDEAVLLRREVYQDQLYSLHVGSNRVSQYRDLTPQLFEQDPTLVSRARMWLRRELKVFEFLHMPPSNPQGADDTTTRRRANNAEFLLEYIVAILKTVDIQGSQGQAQDMLQEFLGRDHARLLLHELKSFLRSPFTSLGAWDSHVQYDQSKKRRRMTSDDLGESSGQRSRSQSEERTSHSPTRLRGDFYRPNYS
ncbi:RING finger protein [Apiospora phragmitis]|uniref:RING-type E3 ubiquitin transferase n=1 Tax=Apiospora phragmitis TaxID=2905665 RepID=A0ABR1TU57_9PEZI